MIGFSYCSFILPNDIHNLIWNYAVIHEWNCILQEWYSPSKNDFLENTIPLCANHGNSFNQKFQSKFGFAKQKTMMIEELLQIGIGHKCKVATECWAKIKIISDAPCNYLMNCELQHFWNQTTKCALVHLFGALVLGIFFPFIVN